MSERSGYLPFSMDYWATQSVQERLDQRALMQEDIKRARLRFWLFLAALIAIVMSSLALEYICLRRGRGYFSVWRWLAGMVPGLLGLAAVWSVSAAFVRDVYDLRDRRSAFDYARLLLFGRASLSFLDRIPSGIHLAPYPSITVQQGRIDEKHQDTPTARLGGPGNALIFHDSAIILERFGLFTRVAGPGAVFLRRFERIREVLDLRPQEGSAVVKALTKDGIPVQTEVQVRFQLARPPASLVPPTPDTPHWVYRWALTRAGQCHSRLIVLDEDRQQETCWHEQAIYGVTGAMRDIVAGYRLDELMEPYEPDHNPRLDISQRLHRSSNAAARDCGAEVLEVRMGAFEPALQEVKKEWITSWQVAWKSRARKEEALGLAEEIRERGLARAYAQMEIILSLAREFQDAVARNVALPAELIILRLVETLRQVWSRPGGAFASSQVFNMWRALEQNLQKLLGPGYLLSGGNVDHE